MVILPCQDLGGEGSDVGAFDAFGIAKGAFGDFLLLLGRAFSALENEMSQFLDFAFRQQLGLTVRLFGKVMQA
ncbi:hypothetical protein [Gluconobacter oxydans]|uniref:hypothetical protein n=1 Tax=Gluconobacter oxydans TaxID=442 RepID=UPI0038D02113